MSNDYNDVHSAIEAYKESDTLAHYRTKGSKNGYSSDPNYTPIGQKAVLDANGNYVSSDRNATQKTANVVRAVVNPVGALTSYAVKKAGTAIGTAIKNGNATTYGKSTQVTSNGLGERGSDEDIANKKAATANNIEARKKQAAAAKAAKLKNTVSSAAKVIGKAGVNAAVDTATGGASVIARLAGKAGESIGRKIGNKIGNKIKAIKQKNADANSTQVEETKDNSAEIANAKEAIAEKNTAKKTANTASNASAAAASNANTANQNRQNAENKYNSSSGIKKLFNAVKLGVSSVKSADANKTANEAQAVSSEADYAVRNKKIGKSTK